MSGYKHKIIVTQNFLIKLNALFLSYERRLSADNLQDYISYNSDFKRDFIHLVYIEFQGNINQAAQYLGLKRTTFLEMCRRQDVDVFHERFACSRKNEKMMRICSQERGDVFDLTLLHKEDIEKVRQWRNLPRIRNNLVSKEEVTEQQQIEWFKKLDTDTNQYFIASHNGVQYGMFSVRNIDWVLKQGETGGFIGLDTHMNGPMSFAASYILNEIIFKNWKFKKVHTSTFNSNPSVLSYNLALGYDRVSEECDGLIWLQLDSESWERARSSISRTVFGKFFSE